MQLYAMLQWFMAIIHGRAVLVFNTIWHIRNAGAFQYSMYIYAPIGTIDCILCNLHNLTLYIYYVKVCNYVSCQCLHTQMLGAAKSATYTNRGWIQSWIYTNRKRGFNLRTGPNLCILPVSRLCILCVNLVCMIGRVCVTGMGPDSIIILSFGISIFHRDFFEGGGFNHNLVVRGFSFNPKIPNRGERRGYFTIAYTK